MSIAVVVCLPKAAIDAINAAGTNSSIADYRHAAAMAMPALVSAVNSIPKDNVESSALPAAVGVQHSRGLERERSPVSGMKPTKEVLREKSSSFAIAGPEETRISVTTSWPPDVLFANEVFYRDARMDDIRNFLRVEPGEPLEKLCLTWQGKELRGGETLRRYGIEAGATLHVRHTDGSKITRKHLSGTS